MSIKAALNVLYLVTGLVGLYWALQLTLMGMYGTPFSWWFLAVAVGSLILIVAGVLGWFSGGTWVGWLPLVGSAVLVAYFVPAITITLYRYVHGTAPGGLALLTRLVMILLALASLWCSANAKFQLTGR